MAGGCRQFFQVTGDQNGGHPRVGVSENVDGLPQRSPGSYIQAGAWFVAKQQLRGRNEGSGDEGQSVFLLGEPLRLVLSASHSRRWRHRVAFTGL